MVAPKCIAGIAGPIWALFTDHVESTSTSHRTSENVPTDVPAIKKVNLIFRLEIYYHDISTSYLQIDTTQVSFI